MTMSSPSSQPRPFTHLVAGVVASLSDLLQKLGVRRRGSDSNGPLDDRAPPHGDAGGDVWSIPGPGIPAHIVGDMPTRHERTRVAAQ